jgi:hypothetical protein
MDCRNRSRRKLKLDSCYEALIKKRSRVIGVAIFICLDFETVVLCEDILVLDFSAVRSSIQGLPLAPGAFWFGE